MSSLPVILILNNVRSLYNVGAIFRTAEAMGVEKLVLGGLTPRPPRHEIEKTALGASAALPWEYLPDLEPYLAELKRERYALVALEQSPSSRSLINYQMQFPFALIVGHEREGVEPQILSICQHHLEIPLFGSAVHSLNVSNAAAIALFEARRQLSDIIGGTT